MQLMLKMGRRKLIMATTIWREAAARRLRVRGGDGDMILSLLLLERQHHLVNERKVERIIVNMPVHAVMLLVIYFNNFYVY